MAQNTHNSVSPTDIGDFRKIRLRGPNRLGYWEVWWTDAEAGRYLTKRESTKTKVWHEAEAYLDAFCAAARDQLSAVTAAQPLSVETLCRRWLEFVAPAGKDVVGRLALAGIRRDLGGYLPGQIDVTVLQDYGQGRGLKGGTIRRQLGALRTVLLWAADQRLISRDDVPIFRGVLPPEGLPRTRFLDQTQEPWFWAEARAWAEPSRWGTKSEAEAAYRVMVFVTIAMDTAARREAILDLTWDRVDLARGTIDFEVPGRRLTKKRRVRGLDIADRLLPVLKEAWLRAPKDSAGRAVGRVVGGSYIARPFQRFTREIGVEWVTPHVLRHTWGSLKAMKGTVPLYDIAKVMGDTVTTIERSYLHLSPGHLKHAVNA